MTVFQEIRRGTLAARLTVAEVYALTEAGVLAEGDAFELIEGEIVPMAAAKFNHHEWMKSRLNELLTLAKPRASGLFVEPSVTLSAVTLVEPDIAIWPRQIGTQDVRGPDIELVIEVSVSSIGYDLRVKAPLYAGAGVRDYWVVDAVRKTIRVHREPGADGYANVDEFGEDDTVCPLVFPDIAVRLADLD